MFTTFEALKINKMQTIQTIPISFTPGAIAEIKRIQKIDGLTDKPFLRIGVKGGGCAGFSYILEFDQKQEGDDEFLIDDIQVILNIAHALYLNGIEIDYQTGLNNRGFIYNNPNATTTCGCGTSFG